MAAGAPRIVLAAGGTAGHIEPALNLADAIGEQAPDAVLTVIGGTRGLESTLVPARGYDLRTVASVPMPRRPSIDLVLVWPRLHRATARARDLLRELGASAVVGFGGYAALPTYRAAHQLGLPIIVHEANATPGLANRVAARWTDLVFCSVPGAIRGARTLGLPLRRVIGELDRPAMREAARAELGLAPDGPVLLVFGGSQGATRLNDVVARSLDGLLASGVQVLHAYGSRNAPPASRPGYHPVAFIDRMDLAYAAADLAIVRGGAMTCAELAAVGLPAAYVPLPIGNGEQRRNALPVVQAGGGLLVENDAFTAEWLSANVLPLLHDEGRLAVMGAAAAAHGVRDAAGTLAAVVLQAAGERTRT